jgi:hypothetical protein
MFCAPTLIFEKLFIRFVLPRTQGKQMADNVGAPRKGKMKEVDVAGSLGNKILRSAGINTEKIAADLVMTAIKVPIFGVVLVRTHFTIDLLAHADHTNSGQGSEYCKEVCRHSPSY